MNRIEISLPESLIDFVTTQVGTGRFADASDYLAQLISRDAEFATTMDQMSGDPRLAELLEQGLDSGTPRTWSKSRLEELTSRLRSRHEAT